VILTWRIWLRLAGLALFTAVAELSFFGKISILGASPDFATLVVLALGLLGGSVAGAVAGFAVGMLIDTLMLGQTVGVTALTLIAVGYLAGRYRESLGRPSRKTVALLGGALTFVASLVFAFLQLMLGLEADVSALVLRDMVVLSALGAIFAVPVLAGVRLLLRPALIEDRPRVSRPVAPSPLEDPIEDPLSEMRI
jgi:rod shape-determining protein MreD